jgi:hypothetical protein
MSKLSDTQIRWFRLRRSGLVEPFATPEETASTLVGVQAQIMPAAGLAIWNRTSGITYQAFDRLLHQKRSLVKVWGQRGTLHVYASQEWPLVHSALQGQRMWWERLGEQTEASAAKYRATVKRVERLLRRRGVMGRSDLRNSGLQLDEALLNPWGGIFASLVYTGAACHVERQGGEGRIAHREVWLPDLDWNPPPADEANHEITRRYLRVYGPATVQDLIYWRGCKAGDARRWIAALGDEVVEVNVGERTLLALRTDLDSLHEKPPSRGAWPVQMLYRFDPLLLGIKDKTWIVDPQHHKSVFRAAGHIEGTLLEHGRVAGTWRYDRKDSGLAIRLFPFSPLPQHVRAAVDKNAAAVAQFFGLPLIDLHVERKA